MDTIAEPLTTADKAWEEKMARLRARKPLERVVTLVDEELSMAAEEAHRELGRAEIAARDKLDKKHEDLKNPVERRARVEKEIPRDKLVRERQQLFNEADAERDDAEIKIRFRALGADVYDAMKAKYPPSEAQRKLGQDYNVARFAPTLIAACCTDPMSTQDAASLVGGEYETDDGKWEKVEASLGFGEASLLFSSCVGVNEGSLALLGKE